MKIRMRDGSGTVDLRFLVEDVDRHGNVRIYFRRNGVKVRIRETPGTEAFMAVYRSLLNGTETRKQAASASSFHWLCQQFYQSAAFMTKAPRTRRLRRQALDAICEADGDKPFALMQPKHIRDRLDDKVREGAPEAANDRLRALRGLFSWAVEQGHALTNPAKDVAYVTTPTDGWHTWTVPEVFQFMERYRLGSKAQLVLGLALFTGARRSDLVHMGRTMERDGWLYFTEEKGRSRIVKAREIPILPELRVILDATPSGHLTYIVNDHGRPFTPNGLGNRFRKWCDAAGLPHCTLHGLRKAGATIAANNGATAHELMAIYGWESPKQAALYTRKADRRRLAERAMGLIAPEQESNLTVPPQRAVAVPPNKGR